MPKKKKGRRNNKDNDKERELIFAEHGQIYGQINSLLGDSRCLVDCFDGKQRMGKIRGKLKKKVWMKKGDIILLSTREFQDSKADIIHKYTDKEARNLRLYNEIPSSTVIGEISTNENKTECIFDFDDIDNI